MAQHQLSGGILVDPSLMAIYSRTGASASTPKRAATKTTPGAQSKASGSAPLPADALPMLDPALFALQDVVDSVRSGSSDLAQAARIPNVQSRVTPPIFAAPGDLNSGSAASRSRVGAIEPSAGHRLDAEEGVGVGEDLEPSIREIVNSLKKAQQNEALSQPRFDLSSIPTMQHRQARPNVTTLDEAFHEAAAAASLSAQMLGQDAMDMDHDMRAEMAGITVDQLDAFFLPSTHAPNFLLPDYAGASENAEAGPSRPRIESHMHDSNGAAQGSLEREYLPPHLDDIQQSAEGGTPIASDVPVKRGRGRPKGSKNKPKAADGTPEPGSEDRPPAKKRRVPKEPEPPREKRPLGRPPKIREGAELEEYLRRKEEAAQGVKRARGRPRKFPGYLVREMRLRHNREEFRDVVKRAAEIDAEAAAQVEREGMGMAIEEDMYDWANDPQNLMDAVNGHFADTAVTEQNSEGTGMEEAAHEPSADTGLGSDHLPGVFEM